LLAAALAVTARAGVVAPAAGTVFAAPGAAWSGPLGAAFSDPAISPLLPTGLSPSLTSPEAMRATAPLVQSLAQALSVTPQAFAVMDPNQRKAAVELAVEDAREAVRLKAYELGETARVLSRPDRTMDKEGRAELYAAVSSLMEMREHYGPWLDDAGKAAIEEGYASVSARAWQVRTFLLERDMGAVLEKSPARTAAPARPVYVLKPSGSAEKLRADMENNKSGWGQSDLDDIYIGYGFELRQGGKHRMYTHPFFPQLHQSVSRQNDLPPGYAQSAMKLIVELERLTAAQSKVEAAPTTGPPATLSLGDLSILLSQPKEKTVKLDPIAAPARERAPPVLPQRVAVKTAPDAPAPMRIPVRLEPSTPRTVEAKPEPPAATRPASPSPGWLTRMVERLRPKNDL